MPVKWDADSGSILIASRKESGRMSLIGGRVLDLA
jgi:hypothetical protein